jgi:endo-1,3-1,4-beta-glycanase ExoK
MSAQSRLSLAAAGALLSGASAEVWGHPKTDLSEYPTYPGFNLTLVEEFDDALDLNNDPIWTWSDHGDGTVRFTQEQITFKDGKMVITVDRVENREDIKTENCTMARTGTRPRDQWDQLYSGEMRTKYNQFRYGRYEVSMKAPSVKPGDTTTNGNYIATMLTSKEANDLQLRKIDIEVTGNSPGSVGTYALWANGQRSSSGENWAAQDRKDVPDLNARESFNTYAFEWLPNNITWYLNGEYFRHYDHYSATDAGFNVREIPELAGKILMNLFVYTGTGYGGPELDNNEYPFSVEYEWFRYYRWDQDFHYPCEDLHNPSCLTPTDLHKYANNPCDGIAQEQTECTAEGTHCPAPASPDDNDNGTNNLLLVFLIIIPITAGAFIGLYIAFSTAKKDEEAGGKDDEAGGAPLSMAAAET